MPVSALYYFCGSVVNCLVVILSGCSGQHVCICWSTTCLGIVFLQRGKAFHDVGSDYSGVFTHSPTVQCAQCKYTGYLRSISYCGTCLPMRLTALLGPLRTGYTRWYLVSTVGSIEKTQKNVLAHQLKKCTDYGFIHFVHDTS